MLENADLVTFTQEILNRKLQFLRSPTSAIFLGVSIDSNFTFEKHITDLFKQRNSKLIHSHEMRQIQEKMHLVFEVFINRQFQYCTLVQVLNTKELNSQINSLKDKVLNITYQDMNSSFSDIGLKYLITEYMM